MELETVDIVEFTRIVTTMEHEDLMRKLFADAQVKQRLSPDEADSMEGLDWVSAFKPELDILRHSEDDIDVFRALLQIRYLATAALLAQARKGLDAASTAA